MVLRQSARAPLAAGFAAVAVGGLALGAAHGTSLVPSARHADPAWLTGPLHSLPGIALGHRGGAALCAVAFAGYLGALRWAAAARTRVLVTTMALAWLLVVLGPLLLAADAFSYLNDARLVAVHGLNPYTASAAADPSDAVQPFVGWHTGTSPYGALFTVVSLGPGLLGPVAGLWALKALALLSAAAVVTAVSRLAEMRGMDPKRAALFVGLNPLLVVWVLGGAHNDLLALALQLWALVWLVGGAERVGPVLLTLAVGVKASAGVAVPFVLAARRSGAAVLGAAVGLSVVGMLGWALFASPTAGLGATLADARHVTRLSLPALGSRVVGDAVLAPGARLAAKGAAALVAGWLLWRVARRRLDPLAAAGWATIAVLITSTWLLPWYGVWLLPLAALGGDRRLERVVLGASAYLLAGRALL